MTVTRTHTYPADTPPGVYTIRASDGVNTAEAQITILDSTPNTVVVNPTTVAAGGNVSVTGTGYPANSTGTITVTPQAGGAAVVTANITTGATGAVAATQVTVPAGATPGAFVVTITVDQETGTTPLTVTAPLEKLPTPAGLATGAMTDTTAPLTWSASAGADGYVLEYKKTQDSTWIARPRVTTTGDTVTGLTLGTEYQFRVKANDSTGAKADSDPSAAVTGTTTGGGPTPLTPVTGLAVGTPTDTTLPLTWDTKVGAVGYIVQYRVTGTVPWTQRTQVTGQADTITGLTAGTGYDVQVKAIGNGTTTSDSPYSATVTGTTTGGATPLAAPTNLATGTPTVNSVPLTWTASANATAYHVQYKKTADSTWSDYGTEPTGASQTVGELDASTPYDFKVKAVGNGTTHTDSVYTTTVSATTTGA